MKLLEIELENFKCYKDKKISLCNVKGEIQKFNVIIGDNSAGKTTILEGIAKGFIPILRTINKNVSDVDEFKDIEFNDISFGLGYTRIGITCSFNGQNYEWDNYKRKSSEIAIKKMRPSTKIKEIFADIQNSADFPLIVYYSVDRLFKVPKRSSKNYSGLEIDNALDSALTTKNDFRRFYNWYKRLNNDFESGNLKEHSNVEKKLKAVRDALLSMLDGYDNLRILDNPSRMVLDNRLGQEVDITALSGGYKAIFALTSDIASRLALAYPNTENPLEGNAIILIDELDLHLHPNWQIRITNDLKQTFPNVQFIITTHSPYIIQSLSKSEVFRIDDYNEISCGIGNYQGYSLEDIEYVMGTKKIDNEYSFIINEYENALEEYNYGGAKVAYKKLQNMMSEGNSMLTSMKLDLIRLGAYDGSTK